MTELRDWDHTYKQGDTPWDSGRPCTELVRVFQDEIVVSGHALDLGCGTGTNAIYLAQMGFDVTGVDISQVAIDRAKDKADKAGTAVHFMIAKLPAYFLPGKVFDFVFDRGCFHTIEDRERQEYVEMLKCCTREGSIYLMLCGNAKESRNPGPPVLTEEEIRRSFSGHFDFMWIRDFRFDTSGEMPAPLGYSCLMRRR